MKKAKLKVKELRQAKGMSQGELAVRSGVSRTMIEHIEKETWKTVNLESLSKIAKVFGVRTIELFSENSNEIVASVLVYLVFC